MIRAAPRISLGQPHGTFLITLVAVVLVMSLLTTVEGAIYRYAEGIEVSWLSLVGFRLLDWGTCAIWVPPIYWLILRCPRDGAFWRRTLPLLLVATAAAAALKYAVHVPLSGWLDPRRARGVVEALQSDFFAKVMFYWAVTAALYAYAFWTGAFRLPPGGERQEKADSPAQPVLALRFTGGTEYVPHDAVEWVEAEGNYCRVHFQETSRLIRRPISSLEKELASHDVVRIHRSALVNLAGVRRVESVRGQLRLVLQDGAEFWVGRTYRADLVRRLNSRHGEAAVRHKPTC
jgi:two-component system LytT family response regulator